MLNVKLHIHMPVQVAYIYFVAFAVLLLTPLIWYCLNSAVTALQAAVTAQFSSTFSDDTVSQADTLIMNFWTYMPALVAIGVLLWAIMRTLKEKKVGMLYG